MRPKSRQIESQARGTSTMLTVFVSKESAHGETRVAAIPETIKKLTKDGLTFRIESEAGLASSITDAMYEESGAAIVPAGGESGAWAEADVVLKGTRVDGVYSADPEKDPNAIKFSKITFNEVFEQNLNVMDMTAFTLCQENNLPIIVFHMNERGNLRKILEGQEIGTLII